MGAYSPAPVMTKEQFDLAMRHIVEPTARGLAQRGTPYQGVFYAGLMLTEDGPKLVEYNARFGDPECQVMMMRMESDIIPLLHAVATGSLAGHDVQWKDQFALTVVMATEGYPGAYGKGSEIRGAEGLDSETLHVFHAGTKRDGGRLLANGGRVLNVTALGASVTEAQQRAYAGVDQIVWPEGFCRRDIGWRERAREGG
jgi:phosphoribosylamine---glycine ligase